MTWRDVPIPATVFTLPVDHVGRPVPKFVAWMDGKPDFRLVSQRFQRAAMRHRLCWVCGVTLGQRVAFPVGPMCVVNRISAEPPSHPGCAVYAARVCPFLTTPTMTRRERGLPDDYVDPAGVMLLRNPGVVAVWHTRTWEVLDYDGGHVYALGDPTAVGWFREGRPATRSEVLDSIESGMPALVQASILQGVPAFDLAGDMRAVWPWLPAEDAEP